MDKIRVHLGHADAAEQGRPAGNIFRPMMHSKIYYVEKADGTAWALVGSHNLTQFALGGANAEAGVILVGDPQNQLFVEVRGHIDELWAAAKQFDPSRLAEYASWHNWVLQSMMGETGELEQFPDATSTLVLVFACLLPGGSQPKPGEIVYFELPSSLRWWFNELEAEIHLYMYPVGSFSKSIPPSSVKPLSARARVSGLNLTGEEGVIGTPSIETAVQWIISDVYNPRLRQVIPPLPKPTKAMQVKLEVEAYLGPTELYEYHDLSRQPRRPVVERSETGQSILDHFEQSKESQAEAEEFTLAAQISQQLKEAATTPWFDIADLLIDRKESAFRPYDLGMLREYLSNKARFKDEPEPFIAVHSKRRRQAHQNAPKDGS